MTGRQHPIPTELEPLLAFVNSVDLELGTDEWAAGPDALAGWLATAELAPAGATVTREEYEAAVELRAGLRAMALANNGVPAAPEAVDRFARALRAFPLVVGHTGALSGTGQRPVRAALERIVAGYAAGVLSGQWHRLRQCPASDCAWIFWDSSAKAARKWCTMGVCGNRAKARAYAARRRATR